MAVKADTLGSSSAAMVKPARWFGPLAVWLLCCQAGAPPAVAAPARTEGPHRFSVEELRRIQRVQSAVAAASERHGVPVALINGVIWVESRFKPRARGRRGPRGLMQLMPRTGKAVARKLRRRYRPNDVDFNIDAGTYYLSSMLARFGGDRAWGLAAYNHGPGTVNGWRRAGSPLPDASLRYAARVQRAGRAIGQRLAPSSGQL